MPGKVITLDPHKLRKNGKPLYQDGIVRHRARWWNKYERGERPVYKVFTTQTQADAWIGGMDADAKWEFENPTPPEQSITQTMTFGELVEAWRGTRLENLAPRTQTRYDQVLRNYLLPAWADVRLVDLSREVVKRYFTTLARSKQPATRLDGTPNPIAGRPMTAGTLRKVQIVASSVFSEGIDLGHALTNPSAHLRLAAMHDDADHDDEMLFLDGDEVAQLASAIDIPHEPYSPTPHSYRVAILTAAHSGLRASELWALRRKDVDLPGARLHVRRALKRTHGTGAPLDAPEFGKPKNGKPRQVRLPAFLTRELAAHLASLPTTDPNALVFTAPEGGVVRHELFMGRRFKPAIRAALPHKAELRFHDLRHTCAALAIRHGATPQQVQDRLGHRDARSTARYSHLYDGHDDTFLDSLDQAHGA